MWRRKRKRRRGVKRRKGAKEETMEIFFRTFIPSPIFMKSNPNDICTKSLFDIV